VDTRLVETVPLPHLSHEFVYIAEAAASTNPSCWLLRSPAGGRAVETRRADAQCGIAGHLLQTILRSSYLFEVCFILSFYGSRTVHCSLLTEGFL
jgi:hypothetical protein